ncbi:MAG: hypothetical protein HOY79_04450 [Streptomyces sp.]|nr:hypothetical protein [Streptomyces sp.]NUS15456.1 hypothetical protein [Streptomyces sp.]NUS24086.1 hypothetical protein [Streptomyces sp.]
MNTTTEHVRTAPATVTEALHNVLAELEKLPDPDHWSAVTDYTMLMVACYGPLFAWSDHRQTWEFQGDRHQPAGALQAARTLTAQVVAALGQENGATRAAVQAAIRRTAKP